ncbi:MAG: DedA family protein [Methanosarcinaceae archaeon]
MDGSFELFLAKYGYIAIGIGTLLEGEIILIIAALMASQGQLRMEWVIVAAAMGAFTGDIISYAIGSWKVDFILQRMPAVKKMYPRVQNFLKRFGAISILIARFFYGFRVPTGVICGMTKLRLSRFLIIALIGCTIWAIGWSFLTFYLGQSLSYLFEDFQKYQKYVLITAVSVLPIILLIRRFKARTNRTA